jgi:hypothetical protein
MGTMLAGAIGAMLEHATPSEPVLDLSDRGEPIPVAPGSLGSWHEGEDG